MIDFDIGLNALQPAPPVGASRPSLLPPLVLAYVGDSVYELYVRSMLAQKINGSVHKLHTEATKYARCDSQSAVIHAIHEKLTDDEKDIVRRGRNTNSGYVPKHANITDYRYATGFEALLGFLFLSRDFDRLTYLLGVAAQSVEMAQSMAAQSVETAQSMAAQGVAAQNIEAVQSVAAHGVETAQNIEAVQSVAAHGVETAQNTGVHKNDARQQA